LIETRWMIEISIRCNLLMVFLIVKIKMISLSNIVNVKEMIIFLIF
jgi:hypothetical protein